MHGVQLISNIKGIVHPKIKRMDVLFVAIIVHENKQLTIGNIYRPPSSPTDSINDILAAINSLDRHNELIILCDFNNNWFNRSSSGDKQCKPYSVN